jgi:hypothetical protein
MSVFAFPPPGLPGATGPAGQAVPAPPPAPKRRVTSLVQTSAGSLAHDLFGRPPQGGHLAPPSLIQIAIAAFLRERQAAVLEALPQAAAATSDTFAAMPRHDPAFLTPSLRL